MAKLKKDAEKNFQEITINHLKKFDPVAYNNEYIKQYYKRYVFKLRYDRDEEIINFLATIDNKNEYIKNLIVKDMEQQKK